MTHRGGPTWAGEVEPGWDIFGIANGGYLMAIAARAMGAATNGREVVSISSHFLRPATAGPVTVDVETLKVGRGISTLRADMKRDDKTLMTSLASFADPDRDASPGLLIDSPPPDIPTPEDCVLAEPAEGSPFPPPFMDKVQIRLHPEDAAGLLGDRTGVARVRGWFRLLDDELADPLAVVMAADSFPPAIFNTNLPMNWTPTLDLTTHVRDPRPRGWLGVSFRTRFVTGGFLEEDGEIWDEEGNLVAHSRQLALVPR